MNRLQGLWYQAFEIWMDGGWAMIALAVNAFILFTIGLGVQSKLREKDYRRFSDRKCRDWIDDPGKRKGALGELMDCACGLVSLHQLETLFEEWRHSELHPFERDLRIMRVCVSASPLIGLLGTVTGMLATFEALSMGSGGEKTMDMIAGGISEALITTQTGLIIALPGLLFVHFLQQQRDSYDAVIAHVETVCSQSLQKTMIQYKEA